MWDAAAGRWLDALRAEGLRVLGYEYSEAALTRCRARGLEVRKFDLEAGFQLATAPLMWRSAWRWRSTCRNNEPMRMSRFLPR